MDEVECVVIGAGVVGLAVARALAVAGRETIILEREHQIGQGISSRSSEVIHAGIYYPRRSLKARFCVAGREALYAYCADHNVAHRKCQKLIVATDDAQVGELEGIREAARSNGVDDLEWRDAADAMALERALHCTGALLSPSTGIIDSHGLMLSYLGDAEARGAALALGTNVRELRIEPDGVALVFDGDDAPSLKARLVINAAGLGAAPLTRATRGLDSAHAAQSHYTKGNYFTLAGRAPFTRLIYPVPEPGGLGVHLTLDLGGQARFGPDVEWIEAPDYNVDPQRAQKFYAAIRRYWPALKDDALAPAYAGVRPKLSGPGKADDFRIDGAAVHGHVGLVNLLGIESPGLTSSLAIADHVAGMAAEQLG